MRAIIHKSRASGSIIAPPSKSFAHRLLIVAALSNGISKIENVTLSNDIIATLNCIKTLGKDVQIIDNTVIIKSDTNRKLNDILEFDCLESGSTLRFFIPIALSTGKKVIFKGTKRLIERGIGPYEEICKNQNIFVEKKSNHIIFNGKLRNDIFYVPGNISSQFISGLLFALPLLEGNSKIVITSSIESKNYIDITLDTMAKAGISIDNDKNEYILNSPQKYISNNYIVEGDYSNSAFLDVYNYIGGNVLVKGLNDNSLQGDSIYKKYFDILENRYATIDLQDSIDLGPIMFAFSAIKKGAHFTGTERLKIKESDRIADMATELTKFGVNVISESNNVYIDNSMLHAPNDELDGHNDHRIVMALTMLASIYGATINGVEAVNKSYPDFFDKIKQLGIEVELHDK